MKHNINDFEIKKSKIKAAGLGLYTLINIKKGDTIGDYTGKIINQKEFDSGKHINNKYILYVTKDHYIDAENPKKSGYTRYINHSSNPNCRFVTSNRWKTARVEALRNIKIGEELFLDYGDEYWLDGKPE